jgi:hypothetical protein
VLVLASGWVAVAPTPRDPSWLDAFSLVGSVTLLTLLWSASHRLAALPGSARLAAIRPNPRTHPGRPDRWRP